LSQRDSFPCQFQPRRIKALREYRASSVEDKVTRVYIKRGGIDRGRPIAKQALRLLWLGVNRPNVGAGFLKLAASVGIQKMPAIWKKRWEIVAGAEFPLGQIEGLTGRRTSHRNPPDTSLVPASPSEQDDPIFVPCSTRECRVFLKIADILWRRAA